MTIFTPSYDSRDMKKEAVKVKISKFRCDSNIVAIVWSKETNSYKEKNYLTKPLCSIKAFSKSNDLILKIWLGDVNTPTLIPSSSI